MRRLGLLLAVVAISTPAFAMDPWKLKAEFDACERSSADPDQVLKCKLRLAIGTDHSPLGLAARLNQIEQFEKDKELQRANCEHGLSSCRPEVAAKIRAERNEQERQRLFKERCRPTEFTDSNGIVRLKYAHANCAGEVLN